MRASRWWAVVALCAGSLSFVGPADAVVNNAARDAVIQAYNDEFNRVEPSSGWTGDTSACTPGTTTAAFQESVVRRVNWYRAQAGLPAVPLAPENTAAAQAAALYQSRAGQLSHYIQAGTPCYSDAAADGSLSSNLALGVSGTRAIDLYIVDPGANNTSVGHRQWIFARTLGSVATGDVEATGSLSAGNALYVVGPQASAATPRDGFVAWPSPGYFPDAVVPQRWSFTPVVTTNFASAQVTVTGPTGAVPNTIVHARGHIVFEVDVPSKVTSDTEYTVAITGASGGANWSYDVTVIDVNNPPRHSYSYSSRKNTCAPVGEGVAREVFVDDESAVSVTLVDGHNADDNSLFTVDTDGTIRVRSDLPLSKTSYRVRLRATDAQGFVTEKSSTLTLTDASGPSVLCPPTNITARRTSNGINVSWNHPRNGSAERYTVFTEPSVGFCSVTKTSCTISTSSKRQVKLTVHAEADSRWSDAANLTVPAGGDTPTDPPATSGKVLKRSGRYTLSKIMKIPAGTRSFSTSGPCRMSSKRTTLLTTSKKGTCKVTVTTSRKVKGKTVKTKTRGSFVVQ